MQPGFFIIILPFETYIVRYRFNKNLRLPEGQISGFPYDCARSIDNLLRCAQMIANDIIDARLIAVYFYRNQIEVLVNVVSEGCSIPFAFGYQGLLCITATEN